VLRIVFTPEDVGRVRVVENLDPMWEIVLSLHQMGARHSRTSPYRNWAGWVRTVARDRLAPVVAGLYELAPPQRYFPDFLTPAPASTSLKAAIDNVLHVPKARLRSEMAKANGTSHRSSWLAGVAAGEPRQLLWLGSALRTYHDHALAPFHDQIATQFDDHRRSIIQRLVSGGVHALLGTLARGIRWTPPVLSADYPADLTIDLAGRGLTLVPSFFCRGTPVTLANTELDPVLVYPINPPPHWMQPTDIRDGADRHLAALIGGPRAALLRALTSPLGTTRLAARTGLSLSSTSEHTTILRNSGLVRSTRSGRHVVHSLTPLGQRMLAGGH
jgi:DNA-binding transcriptional ArsR family regulator